MEKLYKEVYYGTLLPETMREVTTSVRLVGRPTLDSESPYQKRYEHTDIYAADKETLRRCKIVLLSATQFLVVITTTTKQGKTMEHYLDIRPDSAYQTDKGLIEVSACNKRIRGGWTNYEWVITKTPKQGGPYFRDQLVIGIAPPKDEDEKKPYGSKAKIAQLDKLLGIAPPPTDTKKKSK